MLPMLPAYVEETEQIFGKDYWPYGLNSNRRALESLVRYAFEQGLTSRRLSPEELFVESVSD